MDGWWMEMDGVVVNVLKKTRYYYYITNVIYFSCAKDANHSQILGSSDPLFFFQLKLIGADHGLHTSGDVQISCFSEMLTLEGLGLMPTLKFGSKMESTLHYANSDDAREGGAFTRQTSARLTL